MWEIKIQIWKFSVENLEKYRIDHTKKIQGFKNKHDEDTRKGSGLNKKG